MTNVQDFFVENKYFFLGKLGMGTVKKLMNFFFGFDQNFGPLRFTIATENSQKRQN